MRMHCVVARFHSGDAVSLPIMLPFADTTDLSYSVGVNAISEFLLAFKEFLRKAKVVVRDEWRSSDTGV